MIHYISRKNKLFFKKHGLAIHVTRSSHCACFREPKEIYIYTQDAHGYHRMLTRAYYIGNLMFPGGKKAIYTNTNLHNKYGCHTFKNHNFPLFSIATPQLGRGEQRPEWRVQCINLHKHLLWDEARVYACPVSEVNLKRYLWVVKPVG